MRFFREVLAGVAILTVFSLQMIRIGVIICCPAEEQKFDPTAYDSRVIEELVAREFELVQPELQFAPENWESGESLESKVSD